MAKVSVLHNTACIQLPLVWAAYYSNITENGRAWNHSWKIVLRETYCARAWWVNTIKAKATEKKGWKSETERESKRSAWPNYQRNRIQPRITTMLMNNNDNRNHGSNNKYWNDHGQPIGIANRINLTGKVCCDQVNNIVCHTILSSLSRPVFYISLFSFPHSYHFAPELCLIDSFFTQCTLCLYAMERKLIPIDLIHFSPWQQVKKSLNSHQSPVFSWMISMEGIDSYFVFPLAPSPHPFYPFRSETFPFSLGRTHSSWCWVYHLCERFVSNFSKFHPSEYTCSTCHLWRNCLSHFPAFPMKFVVVALDVFALCACILFGLVFVCNFRDTISLELHFTLLIYDAFAASLNGFRALQMLSEDGERLKREWKSQHNKWNKIPSKNEKWNVLYVLTHLHQPLPLNAK